MAFGSQRKNQVHEDENNSDEAYVSETQPAYVDLEEDVDVTEQSGSQNQPKKRSQDNQEKDDSKPLLEEVTMKGVGNGKNPGGTKQWTCNHLNSRGAMFMYADDFSGVEKTGKLIAEYLTQAIETVGSSNVLSVVTDNAANCKKAGEEIEKVVRRGTNGGVTKAGLQAAAAAGSVIGLAYVLPGIITKSCTNDAFLKQLLVIPLAAVAGLAGSLIDSLLGATLQFSGFCSVRNKVVSKPGPTVKKISGLSILDNNGVNVVSILLTSMLTSFACVYIF